jgi:hypothetical protein
MLLFVGLTFRPYPHCCKQNFLALFEAAVDSLLLSDWYREADMLVGIMHTNNPEHLCLAQAAQVNGRRLKQTDMFSAVSQGICRALSR